MPRITWKADRSNSPWLHGVLDSKPCGDKDEFLNAYKNYLINQGDFASCTDLMNSVHKYGHVASSWQDDIFAIWENHFKYIDPSQCSALKSNGSSKSVLVDYLWGPNFARWQTCIWHFCHRQYPKTKLRLYPREWRGRFILQSRHMCFGQIWQIDPIVGEQLWHKKFTKSNQAGTIDTGLLDKLHNVTIINPPMNLLSFIHYDWFREFLKKRTKLISLTETDASVIMPIIEQIGIPVVNQMVSWREGTSFYTCPFGNMHFLDFLFAVQGDKIIDFLNMAPNSGQSSNPDQIAPSGPLTTCQCGVVYRPYRFQWCAVKSIVDYGGRPMDPTDPSILLVDTISKCAFFQIVQQADPSVFALHVDKPLDEPQMTIVKNFCIRLFKHTVQVELCLEPFYVGENKKSPVFWSLASRV